jgi:hypothetical protein
LRIGSAQLAPALLAILFACWLSGGFLVFWVSSELLSIWGASELLRVSQIAAGNFPFGSLSL